MSTVARLGAARAISRATWFITSLVPTISLCTPSRSRSCEILVANLIQILRQLLLPAQILERHGHGIGDGEREFQIVRIGRLAGIGRIQVNHAQHFAIAANRGANHARGQDFAFAVAAAELAVVHHVAGEHGLAIAHHGRRQELRNAMIPMRRIAARGNDFQVIGNLSSAVGRRGLQQHRAGIDLRAFE